VHTNPLRGICTFDNGGICLPLLEALQYGARACSNGGSLPEIGEMRCLFSPFDEIAITEAIIEALSRKAALKQPLKAVRQANRFSWTKWRSSMWMFTEIFEVRELLNHCRSLEPANSIHPE